MSDFEHNEAVIEQQNKIMKEINDSQPLISKALSLDELQAEYQDNPAFLVGVHMLKEKYSTVRRVRGDGNCFYRAFLFAYMETLLSNKSELERITSHIRATKQELMGLGYEEIAIDAFWETFVESLEALPSKTLSDLEVFFTRENAEGEYLVWYSRLLASAFLKKNADRFLPFVDGLFPGKTVEAFCAEEVEPMGKECEQVQMIALTESLKVGIQVQYLQGSPGDNGSLPCYSFPDESYESVITLLYRPGHYDILYKK